MANNIQMTYDGKGRRESITELHGSTVLTAKTFVWCDEDLCQERDVAGHVVTKQFFDKGEQISGTNYYWVTDQLGSVREMTDSGGTLHASYDYDPWGRQAKLSGDVEPDFGFTHFYVNLSSYLDLTHYRAYDPNEASWLSRDPLGEKAGLNLYDYVKDNPANKVDQLGLCPATTAGVEAGLGGGFGYTAVTCCDQNGNKKVMLFRKVCMGLMVGFSINTGCVTGMSGISCDPKSYSGWFWEYGAGVGAGSGGLSTGAGGVNEVDAGGGVGFEIKVAKCFYTLVRQTTAGKCCKK
jgi:RHS repeat-associated protein